MICRFRYATGGIGRRTQACLDANGMHNQTITRAVLASATLQSSREPGLRGIGRPGQRKWREVGCKPHRNLEGCLQTKGVGRKYSDGVQRSRVIYVVFAVSWTRSINQGEGVHGAAILLPQDVILSRQGLHASTLGCCEVPAHRE